MSLQDLLAIIDTIILIGGILGGIFAFRSSATRTANEVQDRVISALQAEVESLRNKQTDLISENARQKQTIGTILAALKSRGLIVSVDGDMVIVTDNSGSTTARIQDGGI